MLLDGSSREASNQLFLKDHEQDNQGEKGNNGPSEGHIDLVQLGGGELLEANLNGRDLVVRS